MLEPILQSLRDVVGVQGAMIADHAAAVIAYRAHAVYDLAVLQQVARSVINSVDSVQLIQDDWDILTAHFGEGKLLLRNLRVGGARPRRYVLAVIADQTLNVAFLGVALRVAGAKLVAALEAGPEPGPASAPSLVAPAAGSTGRASMASEVARPAEVAKTGLSWSGVSSGSRVGSSTISAEITVADAASSAFLTACTRALAANIGPLAKMLVKEAVRKLCGERPFSRADGPALLAQIAASIDNIDDRATFQRATRTL
jgi:predicted regulator of Ras-like GTPase activity (Roadblock/LC7/MglB family)